MILSLTFLLLASSAFSQTDQLNETEISISSTITNTIQDDNLMLGDMPSDSDSSPPTITCWRCDSSVAMECIGDIHGVEQETCQAINGCFVRKDAERLIRGCASDLTSEQLEDCVKNEKCQLCNVDDCNGAPWPVCYTCMSTIDVTCPRKQKTENNMTICNNIHDSCLVMVDGSGKTIRDCGTSSDCIDESLCSVCEGFLCNDEVFPANRKKCHQCNGSMEANCEQSQEPDQQTVCHNYLETDGCFYYMSHDKMVRGCTSDVGAYNECEINGNSCMTCVDADGCNSIALYVEPTISCSKCSEDEPSCSWKQPSTTVSKCEKSRPYFKEETCYSNYNRQIRSAARGCSSDADTSTSMCSIDGDCKLCNASGCNGDNFVEDECIVCDDANGVKCMKAVEPTQCNKEGVYEKRGCFTIVQSGELIEYTF